MTLADLPNGRDLGGIPCTGGAVRPGLLFRSAAPADPAALAALADLGIRITVDLRTTLEQENQPVQLPDSTTAMHADMLADASYAGAANLGRLAAEALGQHHIADGFAPRDLKEVMINSYRDFVALPSARRSIGGVLQELALPDAPPVLLHCTAGKDRTGWLVAVILQVLGAGQAEIEADYLASGPAVVEMFSAYREFLPQPEVALDALRPVLEVYPEYLAAAQHEAQTIYGSFDSYVRNGLGVADETLAELRARLIQPSSASALR